jgi:hypothetical protein
MLVAILLFLSLIYGINSLRLVDESRNVKTWKLLTKFILIPFDKNKENGSSFIQQILDNCILY